MKKQKEFMPLTMDRLSKTKELYYHPALNNYLLVKGKLERVTLTTDLKELQDRANNSIALLGTPDEPDPIWSWGKWKTEEERKRDAESRLQRCKGIFFHIEYRGVTPPFLWEDRHHPRASRSLFALLEKHYGDFILSALNQQGDFQGQGQGWRSPPPLDNQNCFVYINNDWQERSWSKESKAHINEIHHWINNYKIAHPTLDVRYVIVPDPDWLRLRRIFNPHPFSYNEFRIPVEETQTQDQSAADEDEDE